MSESPNRSIRSQTTVGPTTVAPQLVTDPTILDSVAGFINDVVPTTHNGPQDTKDQIQWAHFEQLDCDEPPILCNNDYEKLAPPAVILVLGYTTGIQVWAIPANGEATEILSWRHGSARIIKFLPTPFVVGNNKRDIFASKRPMIGICDSSSTGPQFSSLNFISLKTGEQVKVIKFKNPFLGILANRRSVAATFQEKIAVFDAFTLEDRLTVTTCYLSPGLHPNPVALGSRWMAYAEKKLNCSKRSSGGNDGEGVQSYTATVLHAAKSLGRGLRELGESVASSLTGSGSFKPGTSPNSPQSGGMSDVPQKGIVTILDIESPCAQSQEKPPPACDPIVAHFTAHTEAIVYLKFDPSGLLLFTADKRGHDFHLFRIHPHPGGPALAAVHHLYVLHRGDTSARVQHMCFSPDSRWAAVSTSRGTTHVFPVTPYGGHVGVRTHATPHVVNKMSRFHRSAGLTIDGRSNSPVSMFEGPTSSNFPYHNPRFPPYPHPTVVHALAQIRQPMHVQNVGTAPQRTQIGRQRLPSSSEDTAPLRVVACFAQPRAWLDAPPREVPLNKQPKPVESLLVMSCHGMLVQYDLDPHQVPNVPKERVSSDTPIELTVRARAQWPLHRRPAASDLAPPMTADNLAYVARQAPSGGVGGNDKEADREDERWLAQVEIVTHAGPHRRLWMGPQVTFKTYTTTSGSPMSLTEAMPIDLGHTKPVNMPITTANAVLIESSSASSYEHSLLDAYHGRGGEEEGGGGRGVGESQLKEDLADAMLESPGIRETGGHCVIVQMKPPVAKVVNPLGTVVTVQSDDDPEIEVCEEIIHENCDEALFRPFVTPKAILCHEKTKRYGDNIITKSLEGNTEVAVKILKKSKGKPREASPKSAKVKAKVKPKPDPVFDIPDFKPLPLEDEDKAFCFELPPLDNEDFFSLENLQKADNFEDARDCEETLILVTKPKPKSYNLEDSSENNTSEENVFEDKTFAKRPRKPKAKLGVKIVNMDKEKEKTFEDCSAEIPPPRKSWSSIAASKPKEKSLMGELDLPKIEFMEEFTIQLPKKPFILSERIDITERTVEEDSNKGSLSVSEDLGLLKVDKSSDDEKGESSSPVDTTESDDSGRVPEISSVFEDLTASKTTVPLSKNSRRRKKKK
ncbi:unnamed protein product [Phaedon cochleariae]|uniref:BCAS3 WD40 domain-containing protein n=1 Tax=Phaedon cochleariae TaxID=80249 RepID=A0A9N9SHB7_PHACE|nr:unnamed protein product [Phaedon cochleariae]